MCVLIVLSPFDLKDGGWMTSMHKVYWLRFNHNFVRKCLTSYSAKQKKNCLLNWHAIKALDNLNSNVVFYIEVLLTEVSLPVLHHYSAVFATYVSETAAREQMSEYELPNSTAKTATVMMRVRSNSNYPFHLIQWSKSLLLNCTFVMDRLICSYSPSCLSSDFPGSFKDSFVWSFLF